MNKGHIAVELTIFCGHCYAWRLLASKTKRQAAREAKNFGWRFTRDQGWLCPSCSEYELLGR